MEDVVEQLLKAGADVNKAMADNGLTPLFNAANKGQEGVVKQLLKGGADPNIIGTTCGRNMTPLITAAVKGHIRVCSLLLEAGASGPALRIAVTHGHREAALVMMEHRASSGNGILTPQMLEKLNKWISEALNKENKRIVAEKSRQMEEIVQGIPEWCAQAASSVAAEGQNDGSSSSSNALLHHRSLHLLGGSAAQLMNRTIRVTETAVNICAAD